MLLFLTLPAKKRSGQNGIWKYWVFSVFSFISALFFSATLLADIVSDDLQINAGLETGLSLTCFDALTFGVWFVQSGNREGGATLIRIDPNLPGTLPSINRISGLAVGVNPGPGQGTCTISGSTAADGTELSVDFVESSVTLIAGAVLGKNTPVNVSDAIVVSRFRFMPSQSSISGTPKQNANPVLSNGSASFAVGGDLTIPNNLDASNFGGYNGTLTITVTEQENP